MRRTTTAIGLLVSTGATLLGGLWTAQGLGWVTIEPVACVGECTPLTGPDATWAAIGAATLVAGAFCTVLLARRLRHAAITR